MIRRINPAAFAPLSRRREAFTLLEVLVVVAILVILASVAGISYFRYVEDAKADTAAQTLKTFDQAIKNYTVKSQGTAPGSLRELVVQTEVGLPLIEGGEAKLLDPWGKEFQYDPNFVNPSSGVPDPYAFTVNPSTGKKIVAIGRTQFQ